MSKKSKGKKLEQLMDDGFVQINEHPAPSVDDIKWAVEQHNAQYVNVKRKVPVIDGGNGYDQRWLGSGWRGKVNYTPSYTSSIPIVSTVSKDEQETWHCEVKDVEGCPIAEETRVEMTWEMWRVLIDLTHEFDTEWFGFLKGELNQETGRARITELYFPSQSASGAHVEAVEGTKAEDGTIGAVHSHVNMGAFFSKTDTDHANWPIEIVVNRKGEYKLNMRIKLGCGRYSRVEGKLILVGGRASDVFKDQLKAAIVPDKKPDAQVGITVVDGSFS